jgi:viroplasmin and RNaseH domain-containing protein
MKYITIYFNERTNKLKDQSRLLYKEKYNVIKKVIEDKKLGEIQKKATEKLNKLLEKEKESNRDNNTPIRDYLQRYPELLY